MLLDFIGRFRRPRKKTERSDRLGHGHNRISHDTQTRQDMSTAGGHLTYSKERCQAYSSRSDVAETHRGVHASSGFFSNASGIVLNQPTMIDVTLSEAHNTVVQNIVNGTTGTV